MLCISSQTIVGGVLDKMNQKNINPFGNINDWLVFLQYTQGWTLYRNGNSEMVAKLKPTNAPRNAFRSAFESHKYTTD